jgi:hypothetical protein
MLCCEHNFWPHADGGAQPQAAGNGKKAQQKAASAAAAAVPEGPRPTLIVAPLSVLSNWQMQFEQHTDGSFQVGLLRDTGCGWEVWLQGLGLCLGTSQNQDGDQRGFGFVVTTLAAGLALQDTCCHLACIILPHYCAQPAPFFLP